MIAKVDFGMKRNQGEVKFFQRLILFRNDEEIFSDFGHETGRGYLGAHKGVARAHRFKVRELPASGAVRILPIYFSGTEPDTFYDDTLWPCHDCSNIRDARWADTKR
jgi:hypothetical protein